jgi:ankyrin repeat protein
MTWKRVITSWLPVLLLPVATFAASRSDVADAVMKGDKSALRTLLQKRADVNAPQADGATALHWAAYRDDVETAELLIRAGANVKAVNRNGASVLSLACINGNAALIGELLKAGADANERLPNGETPLMMTARTGKLDAIKVLLDRRAEVNAKENLRGTTPLMWAVANGNAAAAKLLIEHGADVSARSSAASKGRTAYLAPTAKERARQAGPAGQGQRGGQRENQRGGQRRDPAQAARAGQDLAAGIERAGPEAGGTIVVADVDQDLAERIAFLARDRDVDGGALTPLVFAARRGDIESARILLAARADVNQVTQYGWSPLLTATQNRYYKLASFLLENGADPNLANKGGWTPLYLATDNRNIENGDYPARKPDMDHLDFIKILLARGANVNARMKDSTETRTIFTHQWLYEDGATAFLRAAQSGDIVLMRLLLDNGADPNIATTNGTTPLMVASGIGWVEGVTNEHGLKENLEAVKLLLELGADVNAVDGDGRTALHGAAHKGRDDVVQILVDRGALLDARDGGSRDSIAGELLGHTWTPLDYADGLVRVGVQSAIAHPETAALLRKLMTERGLPAPPPNRTLDSICITEVCK